MATHLSPIRPFSKDPIRQYAREAIAATQLSQRDGVLVERIGEFLLNEIRTRDGIPTARLHDVTPRERQFFEAAAEAVLHIVQRIDDENPPTRSEILRFEQRRTLRVARAHARHDALRSGHVLDVFRPSDLGYELAVCLRCQAGISIHLETGGLSASTALQQPCTGIQAR